MLRFLFSLRPPLLAFLPVTFFLTHRSQLAGTGELLVEAEDAFDRVQTGLEDATTTIPDLSQRLAEKERQLANAERGCRRCRSEVKELKKVLLS